MKIKSHSLSSFILFALFFNLSYAEIAQIETPLLCGTECVSPYGMVLGASQSGVEAYSNCQSQCKIYGPNTWKGIYTGVKWQCVEYARRWLLVNKGAVYGDVEVAADIWNKIDHLIDVATNRKLPLKSHLNGSANPPRRGDLLVYARAFYDTGHVAVVTHVDHENGVIEVAEQNFSNQPWSGNYARMIEFVKKGSNYWLLDSYLLGWKHIQDQADRRSASEN